MSRSNDLTPRQAEVRKLAVEEGLTPKQIAAGLKISTNAVYNHLRSIENKGAAGPSNGNGGSNGALPTAVEVRDGVVNTLTKTCREYDAEIEEAEEAAEEAAKQAAIADKRVTDLRKEREAITDQVEALGRAVT